MINKAHQLLLMALVVIDKDKTGHCLQSLDTVVGEVHSKSCPVSVIMSDTPTGPSF